MFIRELAPGEKAFFLKRAREAVVVRGYRASEDLFHYCWFLTLRERLRGISPQGGAGHLRVLLVEGKKDMDDAIRMYAERLEAGKSPEPDRSGELFIEYFSSQ
jgi:hypothetical protein